MDLAKLKMALDRLPENDTARIEFLRSMTSVERVAMGMALNEAMRQRMKQLLHSRNPDWSDSDIQGEIARRFLDDSLESPDDGLEPIESRRSA